MSSSPRPPIIPIQPVPAGVTSVSLYEKHTKIYPRAVKGWFDNWRWVMVWLTQLVFYGLPWLQWNGRQAMLFDLDTRRFRSEEHTSDSSHEFVSRMPSSA